MGYIKPIAVDSNVASSAVKSFGSLMLLKRQVVTSGTLVTFTSVMSSTYDVYVLYFYNVNLSGTGQLYVQISNDNGSTWGATYDSGAFSSLYNSATFNNNSLTSQLIISSNAGTTSNTAGRTFFFNTSGNTVSCGNFGSLVPGTGIARIGFSGSRSSGASGANAIRVGNTTSQTFNTGTFSLFGLNS